MTGTTLGAQLLSTRPGTGTLLGAATGTALGPHSTGQPTVTSLAVANPGSLIQSVDWVAIAPPLIAALTALAVLVADLFLPARHKKLLGGLTAAGLALALIALLPLTGGSPRATFCAQNVTGATDNAGCSYVADHFALVFQLLALGGALIAALLSAHTVDEERLPGGEYWFLLLSSATGAALLPASRDLATLVIALEVASLPAFALVALRRDGRGAEAALKFFLTSVTATAVMLLGVGFVYAASGSLHLGAVAGGLEHAPAQLKPLAEAGAVLTMVGFAFKVAAVPFHFWVPDTYTGAPLPVAGYLSVVGKAAGLSGLALVTTIAFRPYAHTWGLVLAVLAAVTMTAGNVGALRQRFDTRYSAVRLLAWSSVGQAGYLLVPLAAAGYAPTGTDPLGATAAYALIYGVVNLGAFGVVAAVGRRAGTSVDDFRGLFARRRWTALALAFFLLCLAGLPPGVIGLFGKVVVFRAAVDSGLGWLAVVMAVNVVVALYYYLLWTARLFAPAGAEGTASAVTERRLPASLAATLGLTASAAVVLSVAPQLVLQVVGGTLF
ncbi:NADH-quinone oxidoreductase subunit N [Streptomyces sp. CB01881]|uniref:NADH-quinone oxidoreductase subunit N n=1 Tax=Streptomyces sp. CB01881 TaxID=2078691 RepID=UPI000CDBDBD1|nr:NADH-quinone oxidoreductase subunit N [Streptomyces sp. CB01881]AUY51242.1 NADH-quinone oxidoreductase subunit N [Streptomyces sp. CB01881]TYC74629.1 NADH-quinone oxidoreductase subunit N [Streptomyces sp. CB01881]